jgi:hypothetical protein
VRESEMCILSSPEREGERDGMYRDENRMDISRYPSILRGSKPNTDSSNPI